MSDFDYVVIGGGIIGTAIAWQLLEADPKLRVALVEKKDIGAGSTSRSAAAFRHQFSSKANIILSQRSYEVYRNFQQRFGLDDKVFREYGYLFLYTQAELFEQARARAELQRQAGVPVEVLSPAEIEAHPRLAGFFNLEALPGATWCERDGFLDARVSDIAREAGLSHGSYYHYFDSKEQLFREVAELQEARLTAPPADADRTRPDAPVERIRDANRRYFERYRDAARLMGVVEQVSRYDAQVNAARMATQRHFAERSERAIRGWQADGLVDPGLDPVVAADALGAMTARFAELWLVQGYREYDFDAAVDQVTRLWANALDLSGRGGR